MEYTLSQIELMIWKICESIYVFWEWPKTELFGKISVWNKTRIYLFSVFTADLTHHINLAINDLYSALFLLSINHAGTACHCLTTMTFLLLLLPLMSVRKAECNYAVHVRTVQLKSKSYLQLE
jgi:hypothetical protein